MEFITPAMAMTINQHMCQQYGGKSGVAHPNSLSSALAQPRASMFGDYLHHGLLAMAKTYYFHLHKSQPFFSHNQKTALACAGIFLKLNNYELENVLEIFITSEQQLFSYFISS